MSTIQELLSLAEPVFMEIHEAAKRSDFDRLNDLLNYEQPSDWKIPLKSDATGNEYFHNDIELIEGICDKIFSAWYYKIDNTIVTPTKSGLVITIQTAANYYFKGLDLGFLQWGVASEFVSNPAMIPLATPKCATMSFKNGIKKVGNLFGRSLNRNLENGKVEDVPDVFTDTEIAAKEFDDKASKCMTIEELAPLKVEMQPYQQAIYAKHLRRLTKNITQ